MTISPSSKISFAELKDDLKNLQFSPSIFINRRGSLAWWWPHMTKQLCLVVCLAEKRCKHRLGLRESGSRFTSIPTLSKVLETLFDVLEGISISVAIRSADMFASIAVFAARLQSPTSRHQCRKRAVYRAFVDALAPAKQRVCSS